MPDWLNHKGIQVPEATPSGAAGAYLKDDLIELADRTPYQSTINPSANDDTGDGFFPGSLWLNTSTQMMWICISAATGDAVWKTLYKRTAGTIILAPESFPSGPGAMGLQLGDSGDSRGADAVDLQTTRGSNSHVASGARSFIAGGTDNTASGYYSHAEGASTVASGNISHTEGWYTTASAHCAHAEGIDTVASDICAHAEGSSTAATGPGSHAEGGLAVASGECAHAGGILSKAHQPAQWARAGGGHSSQLGTAQSTITQVFGRSTSATAISLSVYQEGSFAILDGQTLSCFINIVGRKENGATNDNASFMRQVCIRREGSTTELVGAIQTIGVDINPASWGGVTITADDTNEALKIEVQGAASTNIRWMATIFASEVADAGI